MRPWFRGNGSGGGQIVRTRGISAKLPISPRNRDDQRSHTRLCSMPRIIPRRQPRQISWSWPQSIATTNRHPRRLAAEERGGEACDRDAVHVTEDDTLWEAPVFVIDREEKRSVVPHSVKGAVSPCRVGVNLGISPRRQESGKKFPVAEGKRRRWGEETVPLSSYVWRRAIRSWWVVDRAGQCYPMGLIRNLLKNHSTRSSRRYGVIDVCISAE
ncbi:hypothetical protein BDV24DRAFT_125309 [Aspergillus arachidicola]|uniref:Uncharacterized protein n=1 Tax=Aspergillus arachidicola TaxID=656916 RepID=A0A5N6YLR5_9EURO|nr:hypothetical protein BDV24DRAFT_125309 [Aspergillus arachidicola]